MPSGARGPASDVSYALALEVKGRMRRRDLVQADVAKEIQRSQGYVSSRLSGAAPFDVNDLEGLARLFGMTPASLLDAAIENAKQDAPVAARRGNTRREVETDE